MKTTPYEQGRHQSISKNEKKTRIQTIRIYIQDIGMEFSIEKCAMLIMESGKREKTEGRELLN